MNQAEDAETGQKRYRETQTTSIVLHMYADTGARELLHGVASSGREGRAVESRPVVTRTRTEPNETNGVTDGWHLCEREDAANGSAKPRAKILYLYARAR